MAKKTTKKKEENSLNLESILFNCRDYLRGGASLNDQVENYKEYQSAPRLYNIDTNYYPSIAAEP